MKRALIFGCLVGVAACVSGAPANSAGPRATPPPITLEGAAGTRSALSLVQNTDVASHAFAGAPEELWATLVEVFAELELPITAFSTESRLVGSQEERLRRIGGQPVSRYYECPGTGYGNTASTQPVVVTVIAQLVPGSSETSSELRMVNVATSRPPGGTEGRCQSTGQLERRVRSALAQASGDGTS